MNSLILKPHENRRLRSHGNVTVVREMKEQPLPPVISWHVSESYAYAIGKTEAVKEQYISTWPKPARSPFGRIGAEVAVKEAVRFHPGGTDDLWATYSDGQVKAFGAATGQVPDRDLGSYYRILDAARASKENAVTIPANRVRQWAVRSFTTLTALTAKRVQEVTEGEAIAAGSQDPCANWKPVLQACWSERQAFAQIYDRVNGKGSWTRNPWVWVGEFRLEAKNK